MPTITGIDRPTVISGTDLHRRLKFFLRYFEPGTLRFLSRFFMPIGKRVVILGGAIQGCELAEFLTKRGRKVTIVESGDMLGQGMVDALLGHLLIWFRKKGVASITGVSSVEITATMNEPPQISRTASAAEAAWTTVKPSASRARAISSRSVLISFTTRTETDIATSLARYLRRLADFPPGCLAALA